MDKEEIKKAADELVEEHFQEWFLLTDEEMSQNILNKESTPKGIIRAALITVKKQIEELEIFEILGNIDSRQIGKVRIKHLKAILQELESRL